ncbi:ImmA/IrrE family metallo-endopeptidase [Rhizobium sp. CB3060]|uniref:ImmA/IrrE family metallo-endopeptidase n=1 Tax=Rhizobium sp. CB3060 TaxID=3138255 RepID=UPI0021A6F16C|nr:ImmA/IrrE family metallo-endopeptidase [Rhizobium tropici]UWU20942.1 ImmA/IrrE family metallo-endopeptidase [Rhizobium tropici]
MTKPDDSSLQDHELANVIRQAQRLLKDAGAIGRFPTPIDDLMAAAKVTVIEDEILDESMLRRLADKARAGLAFGVNVIKSAFSKVLGLFEANERLVILDKEVPAPRRAFVKLHEAGHGSMPHQTSMYALMHDCNQTLDDDTKDLFEREANVFASEVMFQGDVFRDHALSSAFSVKHAMSLATQFGGSNYATFRRYVNVNPRACCLVVVEPEALIGSGGRHEVRRIIASKSFAEKYDCSSLIASVGHGHPLKPLLPYGKQRMVAERSFSLTDRNGTAQTFSGETFKAKQILMLFREK